MRRPVFILASLLVAAGCDRAVDTTQDGGVRTQARRGPVEVVVTATPANASAGERIELTIEAITRGDVTLAMPMASPAEDGTLGAFTVLDATVAPDIPLRNGDRRWSQSLVLDSFEPGDHEIPGLSIGFTDARGETTLEGVIETDPLPIAVGTLLTAQAPQLRDIRPWRDIPGPPWWPWAVGIVLVAGALVAVAVGVARRDRPAGPPPTPAEVARTALARLAQAGHLDRRELEPFYTRLSGIVRIYIEGRFTLRAPRKTTAEFLDDARRDERLTPSQQAHLETFLRLADLVKFAKHEPPIDQGRRALDEAGRFVDETDIPHESVESAQVAPC